MRISPHAYTLFSVTCLFWASSATAELVSPLGDKPFWAKLNTFQKTTTRAAFEEALNTVYTDGISGKSTIKVSDTGASIRKVADRDEMFELEFLPEGEVSAEPISRYWTPASELPPLAPGQPALSGVHIAIDPGHIGGEWARMEERFFQIGEDGPAVQEGDLTLLVSQMLKPELEALGAKVTLIRSTAEPLTKQRPATLESQARLFLTSKGFPSPPKTYEDSSDEKKIFSIQWQAEKLFYRTAEIRARAAKINGSIQPDLTLCIHFNAEAWGDPKDPQLVESNHAHILVNGTYSLSELSYDDIRFEMLLRLLRGTHDEELGLASAVAPALANSTGLDAYVYPGDNARQITESPYVFSRNLLANRLYQCPVLFFEPFVMNNSEVYQRLAAGDFIGRTLIDDSLKKSIYREYTRGIIEGLVSYYLQNRPRTENPPLGTGG